MLTLASNITLIGMPGVGKSFIGKNLAERLDFEHIDLDRSLEAEQGGKPLQAILDEMGEGAFLSKQAEDAVRYTSGRERIVISPGGSIIYTPLAMEHLSRISLLVYLKAPFTLIERRVGSAPPRGIVGSTQTTLFGLFNERTPLYERWAHHHVDADRALEEILADILHHAVQQEQSV